MQSYASVTCSTSWPTCPLTPLPSRRLCRGRGSLRMSFPALAHRRRYPWRALTPLCRRSPVHWRPVWSLYQVLTLYAIWMFVSECLKSTYTLHIWSNLLSDCWVDFCPVQLTYYIQYIDQCGSLFLFSYGTQEYVTVYQVLDTTLLFILGFGHFMEFVKIRTLSSQLIPQVVIGSLLLDYFRQASINWLRSPRCQKMAPWCQFQRWTLYKQPTQTTMQSPGPATQSQTRAETMK